MLTGSQSAWRLRRRAIPAPYGMTGPEMTAAIIPASANASGTAFTAPALPSRAALSSRWRRNAAGLPSAAKTDASIGMTPSNMTVLTVSTDSRLPTRGALPQTSSPTSNCSLTQTTAWAMSRMMCGRTPKASGCRARACTIAPPGNSSHRSKSIPTTSARPSATGNRRSAHGFASIPSMGTA